MNAALLSPSTIAALVIALAFASGLNVYATVLSLGVMARFHWILLPSGLESLANPWVITASGILFLAEFIADKIPGFDVIWNVAHTFVRIPVAALMAYQVSAQLSPELHILVTCIGAAIAAAAHGSKTAARIAITPSPEPVSNIAFSSAEDGVAVGLTWLAMHHPIYAIGAVASLAIGGMFAIWLSWRVLRAQLRKLMRPRGAASSSAQATAVLK